MSWLGLRHKGTEILFSWEWNKVVDGLDILKQYTDDSVRKEDLLHLNSDIIPDTDNTRSLGDTSTKWKDIYAHYGYFDNELYVQGKIVLKDGDPVITKQFIEGAKADIDAIYNVLLDTRAKTETILSKLDLLQLYIDQIYNYTKKPVDLETLRLTIGTTPAPLVDVDKLVRRIHIKVPSSALYLVYLGNEAKQDFVLEPGDKETLEIENARKVYVRSLGNVEIFVSFEL